MSIAKLRVVLQMCLQIISSVISSDGHLKPVCACKFNLESLHTIMNIVITALQAAGLCYLTVGMNHISEHLNEYILWKPQKLVQNIISFFLRGGGGGGVI